METQLFKVFLMGLLGEREDHSPLSINAALFTATEHMQKSEADAVNTSWSNAEDSNTEHVAVNRPSEQHGADSVG